MLKNMNITDLLNEIIIKYNLDKYYPRFQKKLRAEQILKKEFSKTVNRNDRITLLATKQDDIDYTKRFIPQSVLIEEFVWEGNKEEILSDLKNQTIYFISLHNRQPVIECLESNKVIYNDIYDIFEVQGLTLEDEYYHLLIENAYMTYDFAKRPGWMEKPEVDYYLISKKFYSATTKGYKLLYAEKMLFIALYMKNFLLAEECVQYLIKLECRLEIVRAWEEIQNLLTQIRVRIAERDKKDVILFWMDAISYEQSEEMSYLSRIKEDGISFEQAFTVTPHTTPTLKNMFCQKLQVSDMAYNIRKLNRDNSKTVRYLEEHGFKIKIISGYWAEFIEDYEVKNKPGLFYPSSYVLWGSLESLLENKNEKMLIIAHALIEGHSPFLSASMRDIKNTRQRMIDGKIELDKQLAFYNQFLNPNMVRIFMSDHGQSDFKTRFHIHFDILGAGIKPKKVKALFSINDFDSVLRSVIEYGDVCENDIRREYVPIEDLDWYSKAEIEQIFRDKMPLGIKRFGYRGVITKDAIYVKFSHGIEWAIRRDSSCWFEPQLYPQIQNHFNVNGLERLFAAYPSDIKSDSKFVYSQYLHKLFGVYIDRCEIVMELLENVFDKYQDNSVAIRFGGRHSSKLYKLLPEKSKRKIRCFIDNDSKCICSDIGKPILSVNNFMSLVRNDFNVEAVVLSSYDHLSELRSEAKEYPSGIEVIDIYEILEKNDIYCKENFYEKMGMTDLDYEKIYSLNTQKRR